MRESRATTSSITFQKAIPARRFANAPGESLIDRRIRDTVVSFEKSGKEWYKFSDADLPLAGHANHATKEVLVRVVREGWDYYPSDTNCIRDFQEAATTFQKRFRGVVYSPESIIPVSGVAAGWQLLHNVLLEPGDEVAALEPAHYLWGPASYLYYLGARVVQIPTAEEFDWEPDLDKLRSAIGAKTKAIVMVHPNNPTGHIYGAKTRRFIINLAGEHGIPVISDELYDMVTFDGNVAPSMASQGSDVPVITLTSFSKFFMVPGWRIGYVAFHDPSDKISEIRDTSRKLAQSYGHATSSIPLPILVAATRILNGMSEDSVKSNAHSVVRASLDESLAMLQVLKKHRDYSVKRLNHMPGISVIKSQASVYLFPRVEDIGKRWKTTDKFVLDLLKEKGVLFVSGTKFGVDGAGHFRTIILNDIEVLEEVYNRLEDFINHRV